MLCYKNDNHNIRRREQSLTATALSLKQRLSLLFMTKNGEYMAKKGKKWEKGREYLIN